MRDYSPCIAAVNSTSAGVHRRRKKTTESAEDTETGKGRRVRIQIRNPFPSGSVFSVSSVVKIRICGPAFH
jgi:hypothetical protein